MKTHWRHCPFLHVINTKYHVCLLPMGGRKKKHWKCKSDKNLTITLSVNKPILISDLHTDLQDGDNIHLSLYLVKYHQPETVEVTHDSPPLRLQSSCTLRLSQFSTTSTADKINEKHNIRTGLGKLASHFKIQGFRSGGLQEAKKQTLC